MLGVGAEPTADDDGAPPTGAGIACPSVHSRSSGLAVSRFHGIGTAPASPSAYSRSNHPAASPAPSDDAASSSAHDSQSQVVMDRQPTA